MPFDDSAPPGACTVEVTIRNDSGHDGAWDVTLDSRAGFASSQSSRHSLSVEAGSSRTFVLVGLGSEGRFWGASTLSILGPGVSGVPVPTCRRTWSSGTSVSGGPLTPSAPFAMSRSVAGGIWDALEQHLQAASHEATGSRFAPADLPADARSYAGLALVYLRQDEWAALPAGVREAIEDWVGLGGRLWLLGPPASDRPVGFGRVSSGPLLAGGRVDWQAIGRQVLEAPAGDFADERAAAYGPWALPGRLGERKPQRGLLSGFLVTFALLIGPVNLFWFARGRFRHRVYWTTPLLSGLAALALGAIILARDGTGGAGFRVTAVAIRPDVHRSSIVQEQVARTGLLLDGVFRSPDRLRVVPLPLDPTRMVMLTPARIVTAGDVHSGWFRSRSLDAHYLETTRPTRGRVEVTRGAGPLEAVSSLEGVLEDLFVRDGDQVVWHARGVRPGERVRLSQAGATDLGAWFGVVLAGMGPAGQRRLAGVMDVPGNFYATATGGPALETLASIRWTQDRLVYLGPTEPLP